MSDSPADESPALATSSLLKSRVVRWIAAAVLALVALVVAIKAMRIEHVASAHASQSFVVECDFAKFRQIMIRKNATSAIIGHSGMRLLGENVEAVTLDLSRDDRPLLNAIRGRSKSDLAATKQLTVELEDPTLEADRLVLRQNAVIEETRMDVQTESIEPAGRLLHYKTTLNAVPEAANTRIQIAVEMQVGVEVLVLFKSVADKRVQEAADKAVREQQDATSQFIAQHATKTLIMPELQR